MRAKESASFVSQRSPENVHGLPAASEYERGFGRQCLIDLDHFAGDRRIDVGSGFHKLNDGGYFRFLQVAADLRQFDEHDIAELRLCVIGNADGCDIAFDAEPFVIGGEQRGHDKLSSV